MKTRAFISLIILFILISIFTVSCATSMRSYKREFRNDFIGTWVNPKYNKYRHWPAAKYVIESDSLMMTYLTESSTWASEATMRIDERWTDAQGYTYYKVYVVWTGEFVEHWLCRINDTKNIWELNYFTASYPDKINPNSGYYCIYYRQ